MQKSGFIRKIRIISKFMTSQPGKQTIAMHILPNMSRSKSNQIMKFSQLIVCSMRNIFLEKSYTKCGGETIPRPFRQISGSRVSRFIPFVFVVSQVQLYRNILKLSCRALDVNLYKAFYKTKTGLGLVSLLHFLYDFRGKTFLLLYSTTG